MTRPAHAGRSLWPAAAQRGNGLVVVLAVALLLALAVIAWLIWLRPPVPISLTPAEASALQAKVDVLQRWSSPDGPDADGLDGPRANEHRRESDARAHEESRAEPLIDLNDARAPLVDLGAVDRDDRHRGANQGPAADDTQRLDVYAPDAAARRIEFSERELNALLERMLAGPPAPGGSRLDALRPEPAGPSSALRMRVRLSPDQVSLATWIDFGDGRGPFGLQRLRIDTGLRMLTGTAADGWPRAEVVGISVGGVPVPRRWLDALFGPGFSGGALMPMQGQVMESARRGFALDGIERVSIEEGRLAIQLAE